MIARGKKILKKIFKICHINVHTPIKGVSRKNVISFFDELDRQSIKYVILRWYDYLPYAEPGEDLDILVSNEDCRKLHKILKRGSVSNKEFIKCDVYPENNTRGFLAYYPPQLAKKCLENRVKKNGVYILNDNTYFYALTYHALFHKGYTSGINSRYKASDEVFTPEHNYESILFDMAKNLGIDASGYTLEDYANVLKSANWMPPLDVFFRRSQKNQWVYDYLNATLPTQWFKRRGLVCFVVRERGNNEEMLHYISEIIRKNDAEILNDIVLSMDEMKSFSKLTRGGDWGKGPFKVGGGLPARVLIVKKDMGLEKDVIPHGVVEYEWVKNIKESVRKEYNKHVPANQASNILHSTDNGIEASYYIDVLVKTTGRKIDGLD